MAELDQKRQLLEEGERRGILTPQQQLMLEAARRGLLPGQSLKANPDPITPPPGSAAAAPNAAMPKRLSDVPGEVLAGLSDQLTAGFQGTSPVTKDLLGNETYKRAGSLFEDAGGTFIDPTGGKGKAGDLIPFDPSKYVILRDPQSGKPTPFLRSPETDEGRLSSLGRVLSFGATAAAPTRIPGGVTGPNKAAQTAKAFEAAGVAPNLAAVTNSKFAQLAHNALKNFLPSASVINKSERKTAETAELAAGNLASKYGPATEKAQAGAALREGAQAFIERPKVDMPDEEVIRLPTRATSFDQKSEAVYSRVDKMIAPETEIAGMNTMQAFNDIGGRFHDPKLAALLTDPTLKKWAQVFAEKKGVLSWNDARQFRTEVGKKLRKPMLVSDIDQGQLKRLYAGLSQDLEQAAMAQGPSALAAFKQADAYYKAGLGRINQALSMILGPGVKGDEAAFNAISRAATKGATSENAARLRSVMRSLQPEERSEVASYIIRSLGEPKPGTIGAGAFSPTSFVTRYRSLSDAAKDELFSFTGAHDLRKELDNLAEVMGHVRDVAATENRSQSGSTAWNIGYGTAQLGGATAAYYGDAKPLIMSTLAGLGANIGARVITNKHFVHWLAGVAKVRSPQEYVAQLNRLNQLGRFDPVLREAADSLSQGVALARDQWSDLVGDEDRRRATK